jgi:hypothetical protein
MKNLFIIVTIAFLFICCNNDDVDNNKEEPTFTVTYNLNVPVPPSLIPPPDPNYEVIGSLPVDTNKYKSGDTVTLLPTDIKIKKIDTNEIYSVFGHWFVMIMKNNRPNGYIDVTNPGDEFVIQSDIYIYPNMY